MRVLNIKFMFSNRIEMYVVHVISIEDPIGNFLRAHICIDIIFVHTSIVQIVNFINYVPFSLSFMQTIDHFN